MTLGSRDLPYVVKSGESMGGKKSFILRNGERADYDISIKLIKPALYLNYTAIAIMICYYDHLTSDLFLNANSEKT
jgi:hypothetical protein